MLANKDKLQLFQLSSFEFQAFPFIHLALISNTYNDDAILRIAKNSRINRILFSKYVEKQLEMSCSTSVGWKKCMQEVCLTSLVQRQKNKIRESNNNLNFYFCTYKIRYYVTCVIGK